MAALDRRHRDPAERRQDVVAQRAADVLPGPRLQPDLDMLFQIARRQVGHRRSAVRPGGERQGQRLLARPDAGEDERRALAGLVGIQHVVPADRHPLREFLSRPFPRLGDVDLAARGIDANPEAGQNPVPEHRVALDGERCHGTVGKGLVPICHRPSPHAASARPGMMWAPMLSPVRAAAAFSASRTRWAYFTVVPTRAWPSSRPITDRLSPSASAREA